MHRKEQNDRPVRLGLKSNWKQFTLLVIINGFVGGMVGLERTILPEIAEVDFGMAAKTAILSFIVVFGIVKALSNFYAGALADRIGRRRLLITGWVFSLPVPFLLMFAGSWGWIIAANILLGVNQGLAWSSTVVMKIDLVGERNRGLAMGLNESAGYASVALVAFATGWVASEYGLRPYPFYIGIGLSLLGLAGSWLLIRDTIHHVRAESETSKVPKLKRLFAETTWMHRNLGSVTQAGLINNLNDGLVWGLLPILLADLDFSLDRIGVITGIYPAVWGIGQLATGKMADHLSKKRMLFGGMLLQGVTLIGLAWAVSYLQFILLSFALGLGTAIVYPTFLAAVADNTHPQQRAQSIGIFRLWRDLGYAVGALLTGILADWLGIHSAIVAVGILTFTSAWVIQVRMTDRAAGEASKPIAHKE